MAILRRQAQRAAGIGFAGIALVILGFLVR
jgi:hypothetical protein